MEKRLPVLVASTPFEWVGLAPGDYITTEEPRTEADWEDAPIIRVDEVAAWPDRGSFEEAGVEFATAVVEHRGGSIPLVGIVDDGGVYVGGIVKVADDEARRILSRTAGRELKARREKAISGCCARNKVTLRAEYHAFFDGLDIGELEAIEGGEADGAR